MKVESITIRNFKAIQSESLNIKGNNVYVLGQNAVGKSSFIDAVFKIISGKELPSKITKSGEKNGHVEIDLGELLIKAKFNEKDEKVSLTIENKEGASYKSPRTMLDSLAGVVDFDLNSFFAKTPKNQVDFIKQLVGIDFSDLDADYKKYFDERTHINRQVKETEPQLLPFDSKKTESIDIAELQAKLQAANDTNNKIKEVKQRVNERFDRATAIELEIEALNKEFKELQTKNAQAEIWLKANSEIKIASVQEELTIAINHNLEVGDNVRIKKLSDDFALLIKKQDSLNSKLAEIEGTKKRIISEAALPVPELTFDDSQLYYKGLPFEKAQINSAELIIIGLQINLALLKDIKIARFDGSMLDNNNIKRVEAWAKENGLQLFMEFLDRNTEGLKIEIKEAAE
jgi:recombinational DNA repair ATPase RecF